MNAIAQPNPLLEINSKTGVLWTGRVISTLTVLFLAVDAIMKVLVLPVVVDATTKLGFDAGVIRPIGLVLLACTVLLAIPRTAVIGAVLCTAYLGGATATMVHVGNPFYFPVLMGAVMWAGLVMRRPNILSIL
ncbi:MAG: DoxX family protein [Kofleriaceae bacterium]